MKKIEHLGYTISQASNNHIMICKDNQMLFHASKNEELDEEGLKRELDFYLHLIEKLGDSDKK